MTEQVVHLDVSWGLSHITACGKSLHGWNRNLPKNTTEDRKETTCKRCLKSMGEEKK